MNNHHFPNDNLRAIAALLVLLLLIIALGYVGPGFLE